MPLTKKGKKIKNDCVFFEYIYDINPSSTPFMRNRHELRTDTHGPDGGPIHREWTIQDHKGEHKVLADDFKVDADGLRFYVGDELVGWFVVWDNFKRGLPQTQ